MSLDVKDIVYILRGHIAAKTGIPFDKIVHIYQQGVKPTGIYATIDITRISDTNAYLTNKRVDPITGETVYETHKTLIIQMSVRNGSPNDTDNQLEVQNLANRLHKSFAEDSTLAYLKRHLNAAVRSLDDVRMFGDVFPTATGKVALFDLSLAVVDVTREYVGEIRDVQINGTLSNGSTEIEVNVDYTQGSSSSVLFEVISADPSIRIDLEPYTKTIEGRGRATIMSKENITLPEEYSFDINIKQFNEDKTILSFSQIPIELDFVTLNNQSRVRIKKPDGEYDNTSVDVSLPTTITFSGGDNVVISNGAYSLPLVFTYEGISTNIILDFEGRQPISKAVLNFNN